MKRYAYLIFAITAFVSACDNKRDTSAATVTAKVDSNQVDKIVGIARIEPEKGLLYIYSSTNGIIEDIKVEVNATVKQDQILLSVNNKQDEAQLNMEMSKMLTHNASIDAAEKASRSIYSDLQKAIEDEALNTKLFEAKAITEQTFLDSKARVKKLNADYEKSLADAESVKSKISEIKAGINYRRSIIADKIIKAFYNGTVLQWDVHKGDYITTGQKLGQFAPEGSLVAITEVDELFANRVHKGMKAEIFSQANGEKIGVGEIVFVAEFLKKKSLFSDENTVEDRRVKEVRVRLNPESNVAINNRVDCKIILK